MQPLEAKWATREQELIAVVWACETFHRYLWGKKFTIQTDHVNLQWRQSIKPQKPRLARWAIRLAEYEFDLQHRSGKSNANADALSRNPQLEPFPEVEPLMDVSTSAVLCCLVGLDRDFDVSPLNLLPTDTLLAMGSTVPVDDSADSSEITLDENSSSADQLFALNPS